MSTALQEELDQIVRADLEDGRPMRVRDIPLTPAKGRARESLDIDRTFTVGLSEAARLPD